MKILIINGAGLIGHNLVLYLAGKDFDATVLNILRNTGTPVARAGRQIL
ncbi:MAG: hypothetical protein QXT00_06510 [Ignisphaera sp.]